MGGIYDIVLVGVGGQGIILASSILSEVALYAGYDVKTNEVHGMAQRGGSVISQIRFGEKVYSPLVKSGDADLLIGLEKLEAIRGLKYCNKDSKVVVNERKIPPVTVSSGDAIYPGDDEIINVLNNSINDYYIIPAEKIALDIGNIKTENVVMLGAASNFLPFEAGDFERAIKKLIKKNYIDVNIKAFHEGKNLTLNK